MDTSSSSPDPFHGLSPQSLMAAAAMPTDGDADTIPLTSRDLPSLQEIAAAFPDLEILDLIGHGGMSAVFRARQPKLDRLVALKVLPKALAATPGFPERFTREGRVLARLNHPQIVAVHDFGESGGFCYLIMEYVDGVNLRQAMRAGRFTPEQALNIVPALCDALQFAHGQGVLHRDIKPENILLDSKGRVKIADFGIAKILGEEGGDAILLTQSGAKLGTAPYMAPEQIEKPSSVDHRADIYSLGVVFYEMLTGELPLGRFAPPSEKAAVNGNMDEIVFRALAKERERRQQSAGEFKTQIEGLGSMPLPLQRALAERFQSFEYKSKRTLFGMPLLHVTSGIDPATGQKRVARGFFAFGDLAVGVVAFGGYARGIFACGGLAVGVVAFGGMSVGLVCWGGVALALLLAVGGLAIGPLATGGLAIGWQAMGGLAVGWHAHGGKVFAQHGMGMDVHAAHVYKAFGDMPRVLQGMTAASRWTTMLSFLWLPLTLPLSIVPWWARRQLEIEAEGAPAPAQEPNRVFWALPALLVPAAVLWWIIQLWSRASPRIESHQIIASMTVLIGLVLFSLSVPLWMRMVPMNSFYGVRTASTLASAARWFDVNAYFGSQGFWWSLALIVAGVAGFSQLPRHQDSYSWAALALSLVAIGAAVVSTLWWMRQHPVDGSKPRRNRWVSGAGHVFIAVVVVFLFKSFVAAPYEIAGGAETGVTKGSHWMVSRLNIGFAPQDLVVFQHDSGRYWIARVVGVEPDGLRLKRSGAADVFFMRWDKIAGKMLFAHFSPWVPPGAADISKSLAPSVAAGEASPKGFRVIEPTSQALQEKPRLLFLRLVPSNQPAAAEVHDAQGRPVTLTDVDYQVLRETTSGHHSPNYDGCWLEAWIQHPDLDESSHLSVQPVDEAGRAMENQFPHARHDHTQDARHPGGAVQSVMLSVGKSGTLPKTVELSFSYTVGPWDNAKQVSKNPNENVSTDDWIKGGVGEDANHHCFVAWLRRRADRQVQCVAYLKDGSKLAGMRSSTSSGHDIMERGNFKLRLEEVDHFEMQARDIQRVVFKNVVLPPPQKAVIHVEGPARGAVVDYPWHDKITLGDVLKQAGWSPSSGADGKVKKVRHIFSGFKEELEVSDKYRGRTLDPGDKIILPE